MWPLWLEQKYMEGKLRLGPVRGFSLKNRCASPLTSVSQWGRPHVYNRAAGKGRVMGLVSLGLEQYALAEKGMQLQVGIVGGCDQCLATGGSPPHNKGS